MDVLRFDWNTMDGSTEMRVTCSCGGMFESHSRVLCGRNGSKTYTRKLCPKCNRRDQGQRFELLYDDRGDE